MVNDCDLVDGFEQCRALHIAGTVYVHHDKQRVEIARDHRILGADEHALVLRLGFQPLDQITCHGVLTVHNNVHRSALTRAAQTIPAAAPMASISLFLWPMTST